MRVPARPNASDLMRHACQRAVPARFVSALLLLVAAFATPARAEPWLDAGDVRLRADLRLLADYGIVEEPGLTWPRSWPEIARSVSNASVDGLPANVLEALARVRADAAVASRADGVNVRVFGSAAMQPQRLRTFAAGPRENLEVGAEASHVGEELAFRLRAAAVDDAEDGRRFRFDGSYVSAIAGNWILTAGMMDRWWGAAHEGSLIFGTNARPIPMVSLDRNYADAFESPWLSWIGPWRLSVGYGVLESDRDFANPHLVTFRLSARPLPSLELAVGRASMWCGDDRPCDSSTFGDLLVGSGESRRDASRNPGNQVAQAEFRWRAPRSLVPLAVYGSFVGEDSISPNGRPDIKDYLPSRRLTQIGAESWGAIGGLSVHGHVEYSDTVCRFSVPDPDFGCAYEHNIYTDGYRYRGRAIGHSIEGDGRSYSVGGTVIDDHGDPWTVLVRRVELNMAGESTGAEVSDGPEELYNIEFGHRREVRIGTLEFGVGYDHIVEGQRDDRVRAHARISVDL